MSSNDQKSCLPLQATAAGDVPEIRATTPQWIIDTLTKLRGLAALGPNWDSHAGRPLQPAIKESATHMLGWLEKEDLPVPAVVLGSGGTVQFEWRLQGRELEIEVLPGGRFGYLQVHPDGHMDEGEITHHLLEQLRRLTHWLTHG